MWLTDNTFCYVCRAKTQVLVTIDRNALSFESEENGGEFEMVERNVIVEI